MTTFNPWLAFLEGEPKAAYFSFGDRFGRPGSRQQRFLQGQFPEVYNQYLGELGKQARAGIEPTGTFTNYLGGTPGGFDFDAWYRQQVPYQQRNVSFNELVPQTSWRNPYYGQR